MNKKRISTNEHIEHGQELYKKIDGKKEKTANTKQTIQNI